MQPGTQVELEAKRAALLRQLRRTGPLVEGSLATVQRRCGRASCACSRGTLVHHALLLCKKVSGRSVALYVPKALHDQVRQWNAEHRRVKRLLKAISDLSEQLIRQHVRAQRAARGGAPEVQP